MPYDKANNINCVINTHYETKYLHLVEQECAHIESRLSCAMRCVVSTFKWHWHGHKSIWCVVALVWVCVCVMWWISKVIPTKTEQNAFVEPSWQNETIGIRKMPLIWAPSVNICREKWNKHFPISGLDVWWRTYNKLRSAKQTVCNSRRTTCHLLQSVRCLWFMAAFEIEEKLSQLQLTNPTPFSPLFRTWRGKRRMSH